MIGFSLGQVSFLICLIFFFLASPIDSDARLAPCPNSILGGTFSDTKTPAGIPPVPSTISRLDEVWPLALMENLTDSIGGSLVPSPESEEGKTAILWVVSDTTRGLHLPVSQPTGLSDANMLVFRTYTDEEMIEQRPINVAIRTSDNGVLNTWFLLKEKGWNTWRIPFSEMTNPNLANPARVCKIEFGAQYRVPNGTRIWIRDVAYARGSLHFRLSDEEFLRDCLNLDYPGLEEAREAFTKGNLEEAIRSVARYFRGERNIFYHVNRNQRIPGGPVREDEARKILNNVYFFNNVERTLPQDIDWWMMGLDDIEWRRALNWHGHWPWLGRTYWATREESFSERFIKEFIDWTEKCPPPLNFVSYENVVWRDLEGANRIMHWLECHEYFLFSPFFTEEIHFQLIKGIWVHANHQVNFYWPGYNHSATQTKALLSAAVFFPEFHQSSAWLNLALHRLGNETEVLFYPDGSHKELTTAYHVLGIATLNSQYTLLRRNNIPIPPEQDDLFRKTFEYCLWLLLPSTRMILPNINDGDRVRIGGQLSWGRILFGDTRFDYILNGFQECDYAKAPENKSVFLPWAGHVVMRRDWTTSSPYLFFEIGPYGIGGHQHEDMLNIVVAYDGFEFITDHGRYTYSTGERVFRQYFVESHGHNVILVDGEGQNRKKAMESWKAETPLPEDRHFWTSDCVDWAGGIYDWGFGPDRSLDVKHRREVVFVKERDYFLVMDSLVSCGTHEYEALFHFVPLEVEQNGLAIVTRREDGSNLYLTPAPGTAERLTLYRGETYPRVMGWHSEEHNRREPSPTASYTWNAQGNTYLETLILPVPSGVTLNPGAVRITRIEPSEILRGTIDPETLVALRIECEELDIDDRIFMTRGGPFQIQGTEANLRGLIVSGETIRMIPWTEELPVP